MLETIFSDAQHKFDERLTFLKNDLAKLRVGQAAPALVEDIQVPAYGTTLTIKELGAISAPQPNLIVITCWDDSVIEPMTKALMQSDLGINPVVDGKTIKVPVPTLTEERRANMIKEVGEKTEKIRVDIRQIRQEKMKSLDDLKDEKKLSEDEHETAKQKLQDMIEKINKEIDSIRQTKISSLES